MKFVFNDGGRADAGYKGTTGDCACRAAAIAAQRPYQEVYNLINELAKSERTGKRKRKVSNARTGVYPTTMHKVMAHYGFVWVPTMQIGRGCTVHLDANELPKGRIVCNVSRHYTAIVDGVLNDTYDCTRDGSRCVYGYYVKSEAALKAEQESKRRAEFVQKRIAPLLKDAFAGIVKVSYRKDAETSDEYVEITNYNARVVSFIITGDPLAVIADKAMRNVMSVGGGVNDTLPATRAGNRT